MQIVVNTQQKKKSLFGSIHVKVRLQVYAQSIHVCLAQSDQSVCLASRHLYNAPKAICAHFDQPTYVDPLDFFVGICFESLFLI